MVKMAEIFFKGEKGMAESDKSSINGILCHCYFWVSMVLLSQ